MKPDIDQKKVIERIEEKELENYYLLTILLDYLLWYAEDGSLDLLELNQKLIQDYSL